jgi:hypothetical protein
VIVTDDFHFRCEIFSLFHYSVPQISGWRVLC